MKSAGVHALSRTYFLFLSTWKLWAKLAVSRVVNPMCYERMAVIWAYLCAVLNQIKEDRAFRGEHPEGENCLQACACEDTMSSRLLCYRRLRRELRQHKSRNMRRIYRKARKLRKKFVCIPTCPRSTMTATGIGNIRKSTSKERPSQVGGQRLPCMDHWINLFRYIQVSNFLLNGR